MRTLGYGWSATIGAAVVVWVVLPFVISQLCAAFILARVHRRIHRINIDGLMEDIADDVKGLPPEEQVAVAKRRIDERFK